MRFLRKGFLSPAIFSFLPLFALSQQGVQKAKFWEKSSIKLHIRRQEKALDGFGPPTSWSPSTWAYIRSTSTPSSAGPRPSTTSGRWKRVYCNFITFLQHFQRFHFLSLLPESQCCLLSFPLENNTVWEADKCGSNGLLFRPRPSSAPALTTGSR